MNWETALTSDSFIFGVIMIGLDGAGANVELDCAKAVDVKAPNVHTTMAATTSERIIVVMGLVVDGLWSVV